MMEIVLLVIFSVALALCICLNWSVLYALVFGFFLFFSYGIRKGNSVRRVARMALSGVKTVKNILSTFLLIGAITAIWRACGTIPYIVYYTTGVCTPSLMVLLSFLLCSLISFLTGTALGTAATAGIICTTMATSMGVPILYSGGAVLAGAYFGDRCSPMSTSALLVSSVTKTDLYRNISAMVKTSAVPFAAACGIYLLMGLGGSQESGSLAVRDIFARHFSLHPVMLLPAVTIVALSLLRVKVKVTMAVSILFGVGVAVLIQGAPPASLFKIALLGYAPESRELATVLSGGGIISMVKVFAVVCLSSSYAGIFQETGFLKGIQCWLSQTSRRLTPFGTIMVTALITSAVSCNQSLAILLTHQLCEGVEPSADRMASHLENTAVVLAPLIPWSIAGTVPLSSAGAPLACIGTACYLYLIPLWNLAVHFKRKSACRDGE